MLTIIKTDKNDFLIYPTLDKARVWQHYKPVRNQRSSGFDMMKVTKRSLFIKTLSATEIELIY